MRWCRPIIECKGPAPAESLAHGSHAPRCQRVCTRARNKRCDDGPNDPGPDYRPVCSLGTDIYQLTSGVRCCASILLIAMLLPKLPVQRYRAGNPVRVRCCHPCELGEYLPAPLRDALQS